MPRQTAAEKKAAAAAKEADKPRDIASAEDAEAIRSGEVAAPTPKTTGPRPGSAAPTVPGSDEERVPAKDEAFAAIVPITEENRAKKGFRVVTVVALLPGHDGLKRQRAGAVFNLGVLGKGLLPSWVALANANDKDGEVARSRQVSRTSTGEEIRADVERDAGTEVPTYLGGTQRQNDSHVI